MPSSNNITGMKLPWKRHWVPVGGSVDRGWQGDWFYRPVDGGSVETMDLLEAPRLLILVGNPSTGKSNELELLEQTLRAKEAHSNVLLLRATSLGGSASSFISNTPVWRDLQDAAKPLTLLVDGIDEALAANPHLMDELMQFAELNHHSNLRLVFCLRSGAWDGRRFQSVFKAWETTAERAVLELCPLRLEDVNLVFAEAKLGDPQPFLEWLGDNNLGPTARIAQLLAPLIDAWKSGESQALSVHDLRDQQITRLLQEDPRRTTRPGHPPAIAATKLEALAELIAVHALLSGTMQFSFTGESSDGSANMELAQFLDPPLDGAWKCNGTEFHFGQAELEHLLDRPLFRRISSVDQPPSFAFDHHSFTERLAARCFARQPVNHLLQVLCTPEGNRVAPQMEALAAALAPANPHLTEWLLERQPEILLRSDGSAYGPPFRASVVKATLEQIEASDENRRLERTQIDSGFACEEVALTLISFIKDENYKFLTRDAALLIAERCPDEVLSAPLLALFDDAPTKRHLRSAALDAWLAFARRAVDEQKEIMWEIARGSKGTNRAHDRADALRVLLAAGVLVRDIIAEIPRPDESLIGSLQMLIDYELPKRVSTDDLPACFIYLEEVGPGRYGEIREEQLGDVVYRLSLHNLSNPDLAKTFADHWWVIDRKFNVYLKAELGSTLKEIPPQSRRNLLAALLDSPQRPDPDYVWHLPLQDGDLEWLVSSLPPEGDPRRPIWLKVVERFWSGEIEGGVPGWLVDAYNAEASDFRGIFPKPTRNRTLAKTILRWRKANQLRSERRSQRLKVRLEKREKWTRAKFNDFIQNEFARAPVSGWVRFAKLAWATLPGDQAYAGEFESTIINSPGWKALSTSGRQAAKKAARMFLLSECSEGGPSAQTNWTEAAYQAISLLRDRFVEDQELLIAVKEKWIAATVYHVTNEKDYHQNLIKLAKSISADQIRSHMILRVKICLNTPNSFFPLRAFKTAWDSEDSSALTNLIISSLRKVPKRLNSREHSRRTKTHLRKMKQKNYDLSRSQGYVDVFHYLADVDPESAERLIGKLAEQRIKLVEEPHGAVPVLLIHGLLRLPHLWPRIWPRLTRYSQPTLQKVFDKLIVQLDRRDYYENGWLGNLEPICAVHLYQLYCGVFSDVPTEVYNDHEGYLTILDHRYDFERAIWNHLISLGSVQGIQLLLKTVSGKNRRHSLRWHLRDARLVEAKNAWKPPNASVISRWLITSDAVLVRNESDLKGAVLASLQRYQEHLHAQGLVVPNCWERLDQTRFRPSYEEDLSLRIADYLKTDLGRVIVTREAEVRIDTRKGRTDIEVSTVVGGHPLTVIIEHKRAHNREVLTAMSEQLVERYLKPRGLASGIYLISWFEGSNRSDALYRNSLGVTSTEEAEALLEAQADELQESEGVDVGILVLNCVPSEFRS